MLQYLCGALLLCVLCGADWQPSAETNKLPTADSIGLNLDPPPTTLYRNIHGRLEAQPSDTLDLADSFLDGPATIQRLNSPIEAPNNKLGTKDLRSIAPPGVGPLAQLAGDVLAEVIPGAESAGQALSQFGEQVTDAAESSPFSDNGYVNVLTGLGCHKMNSVFCQSTTTTTTTTLPPGIISRRRAAQKEAERAALQKYVDELMEARGSSRDEFPNIPGVTVGSLSEIRDTVVPAEFPTNGGAQGAHDRRPERSRRGAADRELLFEEHGDNENNWEPSPDVTASPHQTSRRRLQILNGIINAANMRVNQVESAVVGAAGIAPSTTVPLLTSVPPVGYATQLQGAQYLTASAPVQNVATATGVTVLPPAGQYVTATGPVQNAPPVFPHLQPFAAAAQGSYYRQHNLAQARAALTNAMVNNAQYRYDARANVLDATHRASVNAVDAKKETLMQTMAHPQPAPVMPPSVSPVARVQLPQAALIPQSQLPPQSAGHTARQPIYAGSELTSPPSLEAQELRQQSVVDNSSSIQARVAAMQREQNAATMAATELMTSGQGGASLDHVPLQTALHMGHQMELVSGVNEVASPQTIVNTPQYAIQPVQTAGVGIPSQYTNPTYRLGRTVAGGLHHPGLSVERLGDVSHNLVKYGMENDWTMFKSLSDNIAELAEVSSAAAAAAASGNQ